MKNRNDFEPDTNPPRTIKDIVLEEVEYTQAKGLTDQENMFLSILLLD